MDVPQTWNSTVFARNQRLYGAVPAGPRKRESILALFSLYSWLFAAYFSEKNTANVQQNSGLYLARQYPNFEKF